MTNETKVLIGVAVLILLAGGAVLYYSSTPSTLDQSQHDVLIRPTSDSIGSINAKITIVEFADFQCPACAAQYPVLKQIITTYGDSVRVVYRNFPLPQHKNAVIAAEAAQAAGVQGKFWEMHDKLFEGQTEWSESGNALKIFNEYAEDIELDSAAFNQSISSHQFTDKITGDQQDGLSIGVNSTPTLFINGERQVGALGFDAFKAKIEPLLQN